MFKKLSNSEYKYRLKVINMHHLNKENQRIIDKQAEFSYKELYLKPWLVSEILCYYALNNLNKIMEQCTISINNFAEVIKNAL